MIDLYSTVYGILKDHAAAEALCSSEIEMMSSAQVRELVEPVISQSEICETTIINVRRQLIRELKKQEADSIIPSILLSISSLYPAAVGEYESDGTIIIRLRG